MSRCLRIQEDTKKKLDELKVHPRQSYDEVIKRLLKNAKVHPRQSYDEAIKKLLKNEDNL